MSGACVRCHRGSNTELCRACEERIDREEAWLDALEVERDRTEQPRKDSAA